MDALSKAFEVPLDYIKQLNKNIGDLSQVGIKLFEKKKASKTNTKL